MKVPTVAEAEKLLGEAEKLNSGLWIAHNRIAGFCARAIAEKCDNLNPEYAYVLGLLHDIGRREGVTDMKHIIDGYGLCFQWVMMTAHESALRTRFHTKT